jgi:hypothetical protein
MRNRDHVANCYFGCSPSAAPYSKGDRDQLITLLRFSPMVASTSGYYRAFYAPSSRERRPLALGDPLLLKEGKPIKLLLSLLWRRVRQIEKGEQERGDRRTSLMELPSSGGIGNRAASCILPPSGEESGNSASSEERSPPGMRSWGDSFVSNG